MNTDAARCWRFLQDLALIPVFAKLVYPMLERIGYPMKPLMRMGAGLACTIIALVIALILQFAINHSAANSISVFWMVSH
jgi:dipeptide/tripeptide permease